jgi:hypothetical protein
MTAKDRIAELLVRSGGRAFCDDCLSVMLSIQPRQQVQQKTAQLAADPRFVRSPGQCDRCDSNKRVIRSRQQVTDVLSPAITSSRPAPPKTETLTRTYASRGLQHRSGSKCLCEQERGSSVESRATYM